ncbi:Nucleotidyl transferase AbiEii toxin, Type IV TA system [compost metagenome]
MLKPFLKLAEKDQYELIRIYGQSVNKELNLIEKDIWVSWILQQLFQMPANKRMQIAFKGGTSLSKVFRIIDRFSEDIDITLDYRQFDVISELNLEPNQTAPIHLGSGKLRRINIALKEQVQAYAENNMQPYLESQLQEIHQGELCELCLSKDGQSLAVIYPSVIPMLNGVKNKQQIIIEFGGRNVIQPNETHMIRADIAEEFGSEFLFPQAEITVLSPLRTFWEKATLIHVECHRGVRQHTERLVRHWFDLVALAKTDYGQRAIQDVMLMRDVVALKSIFFNASYANYDQCLLGNFKLMPKAEDIKYLQSDYQDMHTGAMLGSSLESFTSIMTAIEKIQMDINKVIQVNKTR